MRRLNTGKTRRLDHLQKKLSLSMLIESIELPGDGWREVAERCWQTGSAENAGDAGRRAGENGSVTAWRSFERRVEDEWMWSQVAPFLNSLDAASALPQLQRALVSNPWAEVSVIEEHQVEEQTIDMIPNAWFYEQLTSGKLGLSEARYVAANVDHVVFVVACASSRGGLPWNDVNDAASAQASRIRRTLDNLTPPIVR
jgi:hypothetical protein